MNKIKKAFSFLEMSIVIVIISAIVVGTLQISKSASKARLTQARQLTKESVVNGLDGLVLWVETSLSESFGSSVVDDATAISTWYDLNPQAVVKNHATQTTTNNQPKVYFNVINSSIPVVRFDGSTSYMRYNGTELANSAYTVFVVDQRRSNKTNNYFLAGTTSANNQNLHLGYRSNSVVTQAHYSNDVDINVTSYTAPVPTMHVFNFDTTSGKRYYNYSNANTTTNPITLTTAQVNTLTAYAGAQIGAFSTVHYFNGDIAEIIIFKRKLTATERIAVTNYLSKKYGIQTS